MGKYRYCSLAVIASSLALVAAACVPPPPAVPPASQATPDAVSTPPPPQLAATPRTPAPTPLPAASRAVTPPPIATQTVAPPPPPTPTTTPQATPTPAVTPALSPTPAASRAPAAILHTIGQYAEEGKAAYARSCAKCHGDKGEGGRKIEGLLPIPTQLIGPEAHLEAYANTRLLLDYIKSEMPRDAPGSLAKQEYLDILSFLLVENGFVPPDRVMSPSQIENLPLK
ncbi:MAG: hypothetical protein HY671_11690 [Chloroflexi bacterium]|nr:hypothetical protein [Chloroflexota bacterium]